MNKLKNMNYYKFDELSISRDLEKKILILKKSLQITSYCFIPLIVVIVGAFLGSSTQDKLMPKSYSIQ